MSIAPLTAEPMPAEPPEQRFRRLIAGDERVRAELADTWRVPRGIVRWFTAVDHRTIGLRYIWTALGFFALGGLLAATMRLQLGGPDHRLVSADLYNQIFTMHGTTMMFLFAVPVMEGMGIYLVPLMVGTRNVAFPRLNALGYYVYLFGGLFLYASFALNSGPDVGWFAYTPLSGPQFDPGKRADVWAQLITFTELSALIVAVELIVTTFKQRVPGMSLNRIPLFVWGMLVVSFMIVFAMPAVMVSSSMLILDRLVGTHFFNPAEGGDALLWQHLFWFFGHPEVYIIFIPALGMVSSIVATFCRRPVVGYVPLVLSMIATGFLGFGLWVHHMFATGLPQLGESFFTAASLMIAIPSGVQIFCWLATLWTGRPRFATPLLFVLGFVVLFVIGGFTGVMVASVPLDLQVHDSFFVVAHFHYVLIGGAVFPLFGGIYYWFPKWSGRMLSETLGRWNFWLFFIGFNVAFFPMHVLGLEGMPRRIYTYPAEMGWGTLNLVSTIGAMILALGVLVFAINVAVSLRAGVPAGDDPWGADTLEWATASPPPPYNFACLPTVSGRYALWTVAPDQPVVTGMRLDRPEVLITHPLDAIPDHRAVQPRPTVWPFLLSISITIGFIASIFDPWGVPLGIVLCIPPLVGWFLASGHQGAHTLPEPEHP